MAIENSALVQASTSSSQSSQPSLVIAATFVADYLMPNLVFVLKQAALDFKVELAPYHQVFQQLLDPTSALHKNGLGINCILVRLEDFVRDINAREDIGNQAETSAHELIETLSAYAAKSKSPTLFALIPPSAKCAHPLAARLVSLGADVIQAINSLPGFVLLSEQDLAANGFNLSQDYDEVGDDLAHVPFTESGFAAMALAIARKSHLLKTPARKVLVLDCDNTIWRGVVGEDGVDGISFPPALLEIQKFAIDMQRQGVLVCLASKNAEQDVLDVFAQRPDMLLELEHIVAHRINWEPKFKNLESLAAELNLGLDAFVFLDDNPVECGQMRTMLPQVTTLLVPPDEQVAPTLQHLWAFDKLTVTEEDVKRTQMYRENSARQQLESSVTDIGAFLSSLELVMDFSQPDEEEWPRVAQLTQRTNQFNFTTIRRNEQEVKTLAHTEHHAVLRVKVSDRFGDYGLVGVMMTQRQQNTLYVDTFLLSCRVLGRGVEHAMLRHLAALAQQLGCTYVHLPYVLTAKNEPARAFADSVVGQHKVENDGHIAYVIATDVLSNIEYIPGSDPEAVLEAKRSDGKKSKTAAATSEVLNSNSERYETLTQLHNGAQLLAAIRQTTVRQRDLTSQPVLPSNATESSLLAIWQQVLGIEGLGVEDDFFSLGGTSLLAARLFSDIAHQFKVRLRLTTILDAPTVKALATYLAPNATAGNQQVIELKKGQSITLFLIHDGDGETLLYRNLAGRMPADIAVVGLEPYAIPNVPMAHGSIAQMAEYYMQLIKQYQAEGPYFLGGMCAGGLIAYVVADKLTAGGDAVEWVFMMDSAVPDAKKKFGYIAQERAKGLQAMLASAREQGLGAFGRAKFICTQLLQKIYNVVHWEIKSRLLKASKIVRFNMLKYVLNKQQPWPKWLPALTVREIYNAAEVECALPQSHWNVMLVKATSGTGDDKPYAEVYADDDLGWRRFAHDLKVVEVEGGHASMLQEPHVHSLASVIIQHLPSK